MYKVRVLFQKDEPACYISHLDLMKALQRSLRRAALPVRYSEGFNPHIILSILVPLSTGYRSRYELCDFDLTCDELPSNIQDRLNAALPSGLRVLRIGQAVRPVAQAVLSDFEIVWHGVRCADAVRDALGGALTVEKRSKRGSKQVDIRDYVRSAVVSEGDDGTVCRCVLKAGDDPLNPAYLTQALIEKGILAEDTPVTYTRCAILDENGKEFF